MMDDFDALKRAAVAGIGMTMLPEYFCRHEIDTGTLEVVLPDHAPPLGDFHAVFPTRRGQLPAVRAFIDYLDQTILAIARQRVRGIEPAQSAAAPDMLTRRKG